MVKAAFCSNPPFHQGAVGSPVWQAAKAFSMQWRQKLWPQGVTTWDPCGKAGSFEWVRVENHEILKNFTMFFSSGILQFSLVLFYDFPRIFPKKSQFCWETSSPWTPPSNQHEGGRFFYNRWWQPEIRANAPSWGVGSWNLPLHPLEPNIDTQK